LQKSPGKFQRERTSHHTPAAVVTTCLIPSRKRQQHTTKASAWLTGWQQTNCSYNQAWSRRHLVVSLRGLFPRLTAAVSGLNLDRPFCTSYFTCQVHCQSRRVVAASNIGFPVLLMTLQTRSSLNPLLSRLCIMIQSFAGTMITESFRKRRLSDADEVSASHSLPPCHSDDVCRH